MIKVSSEILKGVISKIAKSARKAGLGDKNLFIRTDGIESIFFTIADIFPQKLD